MATKQAAKVTVRFGRLTEQLQAFVIGQETTLVDFLKRREIEYGSGVRVNGQTASKDTILKQGDIVTDIDNVDGGLN